MFLIASLIVDVRNVLVNAITVEVAGHLFAVPLASDTIDLSSSIGKMKLPRLISEGAGRCADAHPLRRSIAWISKIAEA